MTHFTFGISCYIKASQRIFFFFCKLRGSPPVGIEVSKLKWLNILLNEIKTEHKNFGVLLWLPTLKMTITAILTMFSFSSIKKKPKTKQKPITEQPPLPQLNLSTHLRFFIYFNKCSRHPNTDSDLSRELPAFLHTIERDISTDLRLNFFYWFHILAEGPTCGLEGHQLIILTWKACQVILKLLQRKTKVATNSKIRATFPSPKNEDHFCWGFRSSYTIKKKG